MNDFDQAARYAAKLDADAFLGREPNLDRRLAVSALIVILGEVVG